MPSAKTDRGPAGGDTKTSEKKGAKLEDFLRKVVKQFARAESNESTNRQEAIDDLKFKTGKGQWPEAIKAQRTIEKRPCLTINKMPTFVHQITNDQRQNRPSINVSPVGDVGDPETAKMLKGLIKNIERQSNADVAYDTGFDSAVSGGWGYWRVVTEYEDDDTFNQVARIKRIRNPFRVYLDPDSQEPDGSDAKWAFITDLLPKDEFKAKYPKAAIMAWEEGGMGDEYKAWSTTTHVRIAEYYCIETETRKLVALENGHVGWEDELDASLAKAPRKNERDVQTKKIKWYKLTAWEILEETDWLGSWIPIVKCIGDEVDIEGKVTYSGVIRNAKDPQRMKNFWATSKTELIALAPKAPWIMEEGQIEGHEKRWQEANNKSLPYLLYKATALGGKPAPPPQRQQFAGPPAAIIEAEMSAEQDMMGTTGIRFDSTKQERTYDESGKALRELKRVTDLGSFHYVDNLARSLRFTGHILIDLIPKIYDTPRILTILREDDTEERVKIDPTLGQSSGKETAADGRVRRLFNPKLGKYDVTVTIGPSFATKRAEAADSMLGFIKVVPQAGQIAGDLIAKNMDWPGADEIAARLMSMLPPHLLNKKLDQFPPEAKGMVMSLQQQLQQLKGERDQAVAMLGNDDKDRAIDREKITKDFEAKMAKIFADFETKMAAVAAKGQAEGPEERLAQMVGEFEIKVQEMLLNHELKLKELGLKGAVEGAKLEQQGAFNDAKIKQQGKMNEANIAAKKKAATRSKANA